MQRLGVSFGFPQELLLNAFLPMKSNQNADSAKISIEGA